MRPLSAAWLACVLALLTACSVAGTPIPPGVASLDEIVNVVLVRMSPVQSLTPAAQGDYLTEGGQIQTGSESHVRLDFSGGSIVRLASNSDMTLAQAGAPGAGLRFVFPGGRMWVSLYGTPLEVETPVALVFVDGSFAEVLYEPGDAATLADDILILKCLQGSCRIRSANVDAQLGNLEQGVLTAAGQALAQSILPDSAVADFLASNPRGVALIASLTAAPTRTATPLATDTPRPPTPTPETRNLFLTLQASASATSPLPTPTRTRAPGGITPQPQTPGPGPSATPRGSQPTATTAIVCTPPEFYDPILNRCRLPDAPTNPPPPPPTNTPPPPPPTNTPEPPTITPNPTNTPGPTKTPG